MMICTGPNCTIGLYARHPDVLDFLMRYDEGLTSFEETIAGFQLLADTGALAKLDGHYTRIATLYAHMGLLTGSAAMRLVGNLDPA